jgi:hypothetical protein
MEQTSYICSNYTQYETGSQSQSTKRNALRVRFWSYWCQALRVPVRSKLNPPDRASSLPGYRTDCQPAAVGTNVGVRVVGAAVGADVAQFLMKTRE